MMMEPGDQVAVFRTGGGLYVSSKGWAGKVCSLRVNPYMRVRHRLEPSELFEIVFTRYGTRNVAVQPDAVVPGTRLAIRAASGYNVVTSLIQEVYLGTSASQIEGDGDFLVFDDSRASLVLGGDVEHSVPLLREGWRGVPEPLWDTDEDFPATIIQIDVVKTSLDRVSQAERDVPGWADMLAGFRDALERVSTAEVTDAWCAVDGRLALRLEDVPDLDTDEGRAVLALVHRAEEASGLVCVQCGRAATITKVAGLRGQPLNVPLCQEHALERWADEAQRFPVPESFHLPPTVDTDTIRVDPGWWGIVTDMIEQIEHYAPIYQIDVAQVDGEFIVQLRYGRVANRDVEAEIASIAKDAQAVAATTCEHCGKPGELTNTPWVHVCCGDCPVAVD